MPAKNFALAALTVSILRQRGETVMAEGDQEVVIHPDELELTHEQVEVLRDMLTRQIEEAAAPEAPPT